MNEQLIMVARYNILIIDSNSEFAGRLSRVLAEHHIGFSHTLNGKAALEQIRKKEFDLVLLDMDLPGESGFDLVEKMSAIAPRQEYIIITGHGTLEAAVEAVKQKKIVSFEIKPIDIHHLLSLIVQIAKRKETDEALRISEEKFRTIIENGQPIIFLINSEGIFELSEGKSLSLLGFKPGEVVGKSALEIYKDYPEIISSIQKALKGVTSNIEVTIGSASFDAFFSPLKGKSGKVAGVLGMAVDITDRKIAEVKAHQRLEAEKLTSLISERFVGVGNFDQAVDDTLRDLGLYCAASRTFLLLRDDAIRNTRLVYHWVPDKITRNLRKNSRPLAKYERFIREHAQGKDLIITDISKIPESEEALKDVILSMKINSLFLLPLFARGKLIGYWGMDNFENAGEWPIEKFNLLVMISTILSNAFHRHSVEQELATSEELHRLLLNASQEGIAIMDRKNFITEVSDISVKLFGFEKKEKIIGRSFFDFIPKPNHKKVSEILFKTIDDGITQNVEFEFVKKDGTVFPAEVSTSLIREPEGQPDGFIAAIRDISHRKKIEKQLIHTERMAGIGEMAAGIAHEINQPLNTISLTLDNLLFSFKNGEMDKEYIETKSLKLFQNIARMRNIIDHVRTFSRQNDDYILGNFSINDSIRNAISMVSEQFKHRGISLVLDLDDNIKMPVGNTNRFEQVILNLIINAKDALEEKKKNLNKDFQKSVEIRTYEDTKNIYIEVTDNGVGIEQDNIDKIFLPFYTSKETGSGTGLGLSISFGIIKDMQGSIEVQSKVMKGTTIIITVPIEMKKRNTNSKGKSKSSNRSN